MQNATGLASNQHQVQPEVRSRVLVVDDLATNRSVLRTLLSKPNYEVLEAENGEQALQHVDRTPLDLVVLDVLMPGIGGLEVLDHIRTKFSESELPVLMLTVNDNIDDVVKALETGANDYVTRPFDYTVLTTRINNLLAYKQTQDAIRESHAQLESRIAERTSELVRSNQALQKEIFERKQIEEQVRISQERYRMLYNDTPSMFFTLAIDGEILSANQFGADYLGHSVGSIVGRSISELHDDEERPLVLEKIRECASDPQNVHRWETCMLRSDNSKVWVRTAARVMSDDTHNNDPILVVCEDITEAYKLSQQLKYQAKHDPLTGLVNRYEFERRLQDSLLDSRDNKTRHALLYMDLDNFKVINDTCGHNAGDELLRQLGRVLAEHLSAGDILARLGGDEFGVLLSNCDPERAIYVAENLHQAVTGYRFVWRDVSSRISASIGVVVIDRTAEDIATLLSAADTACYSAKEEGLKHVHLYRPDNKEVVRRHREMTWITKIDKALEEDRFELYYQPIISTQTGKYDPSRGGHHYELLLRMRDESGEIVTPGSFLPAAERYKYTTKIDRWVVGHALQWLTEHPGHLDELSLCSINLSGHSIGDGDLLRYLADQLESSSIAPSKICFELTETAAVANLISATGFIEELRATGCRFALDDFGTGLSSFEYLKNLPVDFVKIDGQFIRNIVGDPVDYSMVRSINEIATVMAKKTVAEFVDTETALATLQEIGIDYAQGYAIARPQPLSGLLTAP